MGQNNYRLLSHALPTAIQVHSTPFFNLLLLLYYLKSVSATLKCSSTAKYIALQLGSQSAWDFYLWRLIMINRVSPWYDIRGWVGVKFQLRSWLSTANVASIEGVCIIIIISADGHVSSWSVLTEILPRQLWMPTAIWLIIGANRDISSVSLSASVPTAITVQYHCQYQCWQR